MINIETSDEQQRRQIAAAVRWMRESNQRELLRFVERLNEATGPELRAFSDDELACVRNIAMCGLHEIAVAAKEQL